MSVQKSNNLSEVDYDDVQTRNAMLMLAENSSTRNEFANKKVSMTIIHIVLIILLNLIMFFNRYILVHKHSYYQLSCL